MKKKTWFTSDWHLGEDRIGIEGKPNLFYRPFAIRSLTNAPELIIYEQNELIWAAFNREFEDGDTLWHLGDVLYSERGKSLDFLESIRNKYPHSKFNLIIGNYDENKLDMLGKYFDNIYDDAFLTMGDTNCYLNHYPSKCVHFMNSSVNNVYDLSITGHIHGLWKVQRNMINVGVDAWHFRPVSEDEIKFCWSAMKNHYDANVFPY